MVDEFLALPRVFITLGAGHEAQFDPRFALSSEPCMSEGKIR